MKTKKTLALGVAVALATVMPGLASAHEEECTTRDQANEHIAWVKDAVDSADYYRRGKLDYDSRDEKGMWTKAMAAEAYVAEHKYADAIGKLDDIVTKVTGLLDAPKQKIDEIGGEAILAAALDTIYCVGDLQ